MNQVTEKQAFLWDTYLRYREVSLPEEVWTRSKWSYRTITRPCNTTETWRFMYKNYFELFTVFKVIKCSFDNFKKLMIEGIPDPYRVQRSWYTRMPGSKNNTRFRRNSTHKNKVLSDTEKDNREWKKQQQRKNRQGTCNWSSMARKGTKYDSHRHERSLVRSMIAKGDWDAWYHPHKWECCDPWKYD